MFAIEWRRRREGDSTADRLGASLAAGTSRQFDQYSSDAGVFAALRTTTSGRSWQPVAVGPWTLLFAGHLDNSAAVAAELGQARPAAGDSLALARHYGHSLQAWGADTDRRLIGEYAVIALDAANGRLRLARSPLRAPPLHYHVSDDRVIASNVARAIFACGVPRQLDETKLADMAWFNAGEEQRSWFAGISRVPLGSVVELERGGQERTRRYYDLAALPRLPAATTQEYLDQAKALLAEGTHAALDGCERPAILLSGGLDSSLVALSTLDARPGTTPFNAYTIVPEPGWGDYAMPGRFTDERPFVEAFCKLHPRIVPHFVDNADSDLKRHLPAMFLAVGGAQQGLANVWTHHAAWEAARADGCDRILLGEFGNLTLSDAGSWAYSEYLLGLRWRQLWLALRHAPEDGRTLWRRFISLALLPLLPDRLWALQRRLRGMDNIYAAFSPLRSGSVAGAAAAARAAAIGLPNPRFPMRDRLATLKEVHSNAWGEFSDVYHGFAQIHGIEQRDPTAYRPLVEFCAGLPSEMFLRDGQNRWLARELLRGAMPEDQRLTTRTGRHNADWHAKLGRRRADFLEEIERFAQDPLLSEILDLDRARSALVDWPASGDVSEQARIVREVVVPRALILGRFVNYVGGKN